jgi:hypothetical protein
MEEGIGSLNILESAKKDRGGVRWAGYVAPMGATRSGERIFVGNSEGGEREGGSLGKSTHRWSSTKIGLREMGCGNMDWIHVA